jgi:hypothetical protein
LRCIKLRYYLIFSSWEIEPYIRQFRKQTKGEKDHSRVQSVEHQSPECSLLQRAGLEVKERARTLGNIY